MTRTATAAAASTLLLLAAASAARLTAQGQPSHVRVAQGRAAPDATAEEANRALAAAFADAWNRHDMQAFGRLLARDVDWVNVDAGRGRGWEATVRGHERVHAGKFRESVMTIGNVDVSLVRPDVAVVHVAWGLRGDRNDDDTPRPPREGLFTWLTVRDADGWKIRASHNTNRTPPR